jgi:hypothetical protein
MKLISRNISLVLAAAALAAGCSGGGGGGSEESSPPPPVNAAPTISSLADQTIDEGTETAPMSFTVRDAETAASALTVSVSSSNGSIVPDSAIELTGSGAARSLMIFPAAEQSGTATITVAVRDGDGAQASSKFELTVTPLLRTQFSGWLRGTVLSRERESNPVGEPAEEGQSLPQIEDINRLKPEDDTAGDPAAYDDLIPLEEPEEA